MNLTGPIKKAESLINLISKSGVTISNKKIKSEAEKWVADCSSDLFDFLASNPKAIKELKYLTRSVNNLRLLRKKWLKGLRIIIKSLKELKFTGEKQILIFDPDKPFTAYQILKELFSKAKKEVLIYDGYVEEGILDILSLVLQNAKIKILTNHTYGKFLRELPKFKREFTNSEIKKSLVVHDRFFFIDRKCFISGISLHALGGKKPSHIFEVNKEITNILKNHFENIWNQADKIL